MPSPSSEGVSAVPRDTGVHGWTRTRASVPCNSVRYESSVTSVSWIPSEAIDALSQKIPFDVGFGHYDSPPPDVVDDLEALRDNDRFRFANRLAAFIEVEDGRIVDSGFTGGGLIGSTTLRLGRRSMTFQAVPYPDIQRGPEVGDGFVRFVQTTGGRPGIPAPRLVRKRPFVQVKGPTVWTTLALTLRADGTSQFEVEGASPFPRHWIYDADGRITAKVGTTNFKDWYHNAFGVHSPWGDEDSPAIVTAAETALERQLSTALMHGTAKPEIRVLAQGEVLTEEGTTGSDVYLILDGVVEVESKGKVLGALGPGALVGERGPLEGGVRTATLRAETRCRVASVPFESLDRQRLAELTAAHRREEQ
ncbi:MAG: hypothetical protein QOG64_556 [Acidimicrobiaceae bacterium]|nr:hypothetical protein [Acidimicrobiaceae bacterium]